MLYDRTVTHMTWRPVNSAHAIERVRFVVQFRQSLSEKLMARLRDAADKHVSETRMAGPTPLQTVRVALQVTPDGQQKLFSPAAEGAGWQYVRSSTQGQPLEVLAFQENQIIYETTEYRKWDTFLQRFDKVAGGAVRTALPTLDVEIASLEYYDRFLFEGSSHEADPRTLLTGIETLLPTDAASGRAMWHIHRGWYERGPHGDVLVNQNFDAVDGHLVEDGPLVRTIALLTKVELRSATYAINGETIEPTLELLHDFTGQHFRSALRPTMLKAVGIHGDTRA